MRKNRQADLGNNCAHCAKNVQLEGIVVQYVSFAFFIDDIFVGLFLEI